jgi:SWI/SNF-related matrix-associated actin-dependent regulator 1 of chromatin subfamily A
VDEIPDYVTRSNVKTILETLPYESVQRCFDALVKKKGNLNDAQAWLLEDEEQDAPGEDDDDDVDELSSTTPARPRGIAISSSSQPVRPAAKQEVKAPVQTIAEKYRGTQAARRPSQAEEAIQQPRRRLQQGRRKPSPTPSSSSPVQKPPQPLQRLHRKPKVVSDDEEDEVIEIRSDSGTLEEEVEEEESSHDQRLLKFLNDCSIDDLADLTAQPKDQLTILIEQRPFANLDEIRVVTAAPSQTKGGKKSKARPIGQKVVETCSEAWISYDAIDELVKECEAIATPLQAALKSWGVGTSDEGELQLMNLDEAHDSGIGTPTSSCPSDEVTPSVKTRNKSQFLKQPTNMNPEATLKDYQLVGLNWLNLLWSQKISCILADDMGLGKTCQVIAFLAHLQQTGVQCCALIIVPGSTLENWLREFQYFAPSLSVRPYYGKQDERGLLQAQIEADMDSIDVVVTTYDMASSSKGLTRDSWWLRTQLKPEICIFDEAHSLRNPGTDRYAKLAKFRSEFRVLLTGTPLQNNLKELVAILGFIRPDMFHEREAALDYIFKHKATTKDPTENAALLSAQRIMRARSMVTPFILRRKKHQVLDLPAKHSRIEHCDMTETQAQYYANVFEDAQKFFAAKSNAKGGGKQSSNILMGLRKAALHPLLGRRVFDDSKIEKITDLCVKHQEFGSARKDQVRAHVAGESHDGLRGGDYGLHLFCSDTAMPYLKRFALKGKPWMDSGKVVIFRKLIEDFADNGDRILVFSQFKIMMDILEAVLQTLNVKFMRLDGSTEVQVRQHYIDTFTNDESITVFMLSTRAGGAGINLAAANKVIIFDAGFNPQDDIQAENRAHRVGQTRDVEVIRLVTRGTIEEQIHALGESKLALDARVAGEAEAAEDTKAADKAGEQMVEQMFLDSLKKEAEAETVAKTSMNDLKDAFKSGLESAGLQVASKQAQF